VTHTSPKASCCENSPCNPSNRTNGCDGADPQRLCQRVDHTLAAGNPPRVRDGAARSFSRSAASSAPVPAPRERPSAFDGRPTSRRRALQCVIDRRDAVFRGHSPRRPD
jgi:hypothetical protein